MSEMVERVAKAITESALEEFVVILPDQAERFARAAVSAMRVPTETMVESAWADALAEDAKSVWADMIDEALK